MSVRSAVRRLDDFNLAAVRQLRPVGSERNGFIQGVRFNDGHAEDVARFPIQPVH